MRDNQLLKRGMIRVLFRQSQACFDLPRDHDPLTISLWAKDITDLLQNLIWVKYGLNKREDTVLHLFDVEQVVNKGLHEEYLRQDHFELLVNHF